MNEHIFKYKGYKVIIYTSYESQEKGGYIEISYLDGCLTKRTAFCQYASAQQLFKEAIGQVDSLIKDSKEFDEYNLLLRNLISLHEETEWL